MKVYGSTCAEQYRTAESCDRNGDTARRPTLRWGSPRASRTGPDGVAALRFQRLQPDERDVRAGRRHFENIPNVAAIAQENGTWIAAPRLDADHYAGRPFYRGWAQVTGWLEGVGHHVLAFLRFVPDRWLELRRLHRSLARSARGSPPRTYGLLLCVSAPPLAQTSSLATGVGGRTRPCLNRFCYDVSSTSPKSDAPVRAIYARKKCGHPWPPKPANEAFSCVFERIHTRESIPEAHAWKTAPELAFKPLPR